MSEEVAQATNVPTSGGSNAEDFQPQTQNPQSVGSNLQQSGSTGQSTSNQDILTNQNARIIVPTEPADPPASTTTEASGMNWWPIFGLIVLTGIVIWAIIYYMLRKTRPEPVAITEDETVTIPKTTRPKSIPINVSEPKANTPLKKSKPKKSKSKRKKSRK